MWQLYTLFLVDIVVLLKSKKFTHNNLLRTVAAGVQKENIKKCSPSRVRKSPHTVVTKGIS